MPTERAELQFRLATPNDREPLLQLLSELRVPVAGTVSAAAHTALIRSIGDRRLVLLLAESNDRLAGLCVGVIEAKRFWRALAWRNPALIMERIPALIKRKLRKKQRGAAATGDPVGLAELLSPPSGRNWNESSPQIGYIALVLLHPDVRQRGASPAFMQALLDEFVLRGARRMDARIARSNIASVRMCRALGVIVEDRGANLFATADLPLSGSSS